MYLIAGANLFGQWFSDKNVFAQFQPLQIDDKRNDLKFILKEAKIICTNWSYSVFQIENRFYISGSWRGKENQLMRVRLPEECEGTEYNLTMAGNDYCLILVNIKSRVMWITDFETDAIKKISFNTERPLSQPSANMPSKKIRRDDSIIKVVATNNLSLYLTADGFVYTGLLPTHLDTSHCKGKVCDIQCGYEHCILLTDVGRVYTWGNGRRLQLGHGDIFNLDIPTELEALAGIKIIKVKAGGWHSLALSEFGDLYAWGWNDTGQLGIKSDPNDLPGQGVLKNEGLKSFPLPTLINLFNEDDKEILLNVKDLACGTRHSAILLEDNSVWTTGYNKYGQLGFSPTTQPVVNYFKKSFHSKDIAELICGPWATILINKKLCI